jgi:putative membrane protein
MLKALFRRTIVNALSLYFVAQVLSGVEVSGGFLTYIFGGLALALLFYIVKPILNIFSAPLNILTLGFFSIFTNIIIFYLLTVFVSDISITAFTFKGVFFAGFVIPSVRFSPFFAFWAVSFLQSIFVSFITWLFKQKS